MNNYTHRRLRSIDQAPAVFVAVAVALACAFWATHAQDVVSSSDDLDGDQVQDVVSSSPEGEVGATGPGVVFVSSGADGDLVVRFQGGQDGDLFGYSVHSSSDIDGDGSKDLIVGAPNEGQGRAYIFIGPFLNNGPLTLTVDDADMAFEPADFNASSFGEQVAAVVDLDCDGIMDFRFSGWTHDDDDDDDLFMSTYIVSGWTGDPLFVIADGDPFDPWVYVQGDVDGDSDVDQTDVQIIQQNMGMSGPVTSFDGDLNGDGIVNGADLGLVQGNFGAVGYSDLIGTVCAPVCDEPIPPGWHCVADCDGTFIQLPDNVWPECEPVLVCPGPGCWVCIGGCALPELPDLPRMGDEVLLISETVPQGGDVAWWIPLGSEHLSVLGTLEDDDLMLRLDEPGAVTVRVMWFNCHWCYDEVTFYIHADIDTDGDGLPDLWEIEHGLDPWSADSDGDGIPDGQEDPDADGIINIWEYLYGTDPYDGSDAPGIDADGDGIPDECEFLMGTDPNDPFDPVDPWMDSDNDGLADALEFCGYGTDPYYYDSDFDGLPDGWEVQYGSNPLNDDTDGDGILDWQEDFDGDGLNNLDEWLYGTNPLNEDTDGDGVSDGDEAAQGSNPNDPSDGGQVDPNDVVDLVLTIGDPSGSESERWMIRVGYLGAAAPGYGEVVTVTRKIKKGESYPITVRHLGTDPSFMQEWGAPNYDYRALVAVSADECALIDDPDQLLGEWYEEGCCANYPETCVQCTWPGCCNNANVDGNPSGELKVAWLHLPKVDLDVDANNDGIIDDADEDVEDSGSGKLIFLNTADTDGDGVPDYADGYNFNQSANADRDDLSEFDQFVELRLTIPDDMDLQDATLRFEYVESDPAFVVPPIPPSMSYTPAPGSLRIWTKNGSEQRSAQSVAVGGDYVAPAADIAIDALDLDGQTGTLTLWVEAIAPSSTLGDLAITAYLNTDDLSECSDEVRLTAFGTRLVAVDANEQLTPIDFPDFTNASPIVSLTQLSYATPYVSEDYTRVLTDITIVGTFDDAISDLTPGNDGIIDQLYVHLNSEPLLDPVTGEPYVIPQEDLTISKIVNDASILKRHDFSASFTHTIVGVEIEPGWNLVRVLATNSSGFSGFGDRGIEVEPLPPPDLQLNFMTYFVSETQLVLLVFDEIGGEIYCDTFSPSGEEGVWVGDIFGGIVDFIAGDVVFDPAIPDELGATFSITHDAVDLHLDEHTVWLVEDGIDSGLLVGDDLIEEFERPDWWDYQFQISDETPILFSEGGSFSPFLIELLGPSEITDLIDQVEMDATLDPFNSTLTIFDLLSWDDRRWLVRPGDLTPAAIVAIPSYEQSMYEVMTGDDFAELAWAMGALQFDYTRGFGVGLWDTGVDIVDGVGAMAKGLWYVVYHYNGIAITFRFISSGEFLLEEDRQRIQALARFAEAVAPIIADLLEDRDDLAYALLTHDVEEMNRLGEEYAFVGELLVDIIDQVREEILAATPGEIGYTAGWITGRITGEVAVEVLLAVATAGIGNAALHSARMGGAVARISSKFHTLADIVPDDVPGLSPQLMHTIADKIEDMADYIQAMATTKMCFAPGTLVHTADGLRAIETIRIGDFVLSRCERTGAQGLKPVLETVVTRPDRLFHLTYRPRQPHVARAAHRSRAMHGDDDDDGNGGDGDEDDEEDGSAGETTLICTGQHPFFVIDRREFIPVEDLVLGDHLQLTDGSTASVVEISVEYASSSAKPFTTYNLEVADWHTYFVGPRDAGVWVHNATRKPACERAFGFIQRVVRNNPELDHWDALVEVLVRTNTPGRRKAFDPVMSEVVEATMQAMYRDAVLPDGTVDLTKLKSIAEVNAFRFGNPLGVRIQRIDLHNHHVATKEWAEVLYKQAHGQGAEPPGGWNAWFDTMPGYLVNKHHHVHHTVNDDAGIAAFHKILSERLPSTSTTDRTKILNELRASYLEWDADEGSRVWDVAKAWIEAEGL